jgi:hypothetical protein
LSFLCGHNLGLVQELRDSQLDQLNIPGLFYYFCIWPACNQPIGGCADSTQSLSAQLLPGIEDVNQVAQSLVIVIYLEDTALAPILSEMGCHLECCWQGVVVSKGEYRDWLLSSLDGLERSMFGSARQNEKDWRIWS